MTSPFCWYQEVERMDVAALLELIFGFILQLLELVFGFAGGLPGDGDEDDEEDDD
jgi:hypothetical protein